MLEIRHFDDAQIVLLKRTGSGSQLIATLTGDNREQNARLLAAAFDLQDAATELVREIDSLDGIATMPYRSSVRLAKTNDAVRVALGQQSRLATDQ